VDPARPRLPADDDPHDAGHRGHGHDGRGQPDQRSREQMSMDELKQARDELNEEIGQRTERTALR
jgi:hypothetical protein